MNRPIEPMNVGKARMILNDAQTRVPIVYTVRRAADQFGWDEETMLTVVVAMLLDQNFELTEEVRRLRGRSVFGKDVAP